MTNFWAVSVAGGKGSRFGGDTPKQYITLGNKPLFRHSADVLMSLPGLLGFVIAVPAGMEDATLDMLGTPTNEGAPVAVSTGGATRDASVYGALKALETLWAEDDDVVVIHDAARPLVTAAEFLAVIDAAAESGAAFLGVEPSDTIKEREDPIGKGAITTLRRDALVCARTPQAFRFGDILAAHAALASRQAESGTKSVVFDDAQLLERLADGKGASPVIVWGGESSFKVTSKADFILAESMLKVINNNQ